MPIYCYRCTCGITREERRKGKERYDLPTCECGKRMRLAILAPALDPKRKTEGK